MATAEIETEEDWNEWLSRLTVEHRKRLVLDRHVVVATDFKKEEAAVVEDIILSSQPGERP